MNKRQVIYCCLFAVGLFLTASYSIDDRGFHSGAFGIVGCILILISYAGLNWSKLKVPKSSARKVLSILTIVLVVLIILDIVELILN